MVNFAHKDLTDQLLADADTIIDELCTENKKKKPDDKESEKGEYAFTSVQFIRRVARRYPGVYIQLLQRSLEKSGEQWAFNHAHEAIGGALYWHMNRKGWDLQRIPKDDKDIFLQSTDRVIYRPKAG